jgi:predicted  nucleic acid-binding Zn-ribbon protein
MTLHELLEIQRLDLEVRQLRHRRANLPQRSSSETVANEMTARQAKLDELTFERDDRLGDQQRLEAEVQVVRMRAEGDEARLYGGEVNGIKELEALQHEIAGLRERQSELENRVLTLMEQVEELNGPIEGLAEDQMASEALLERFAAEIATAEADIDRELATVLEQRKVQAELVDPALLSEYQRLEPSFGSATIVQFDGTGCVGCPSQMPAVEVDRIRRRAGDDPTNCQECGRIVLH